MNETAYTIRIGIEILIAFGAVFVYHFLLAYVRNNNGLTFKPTVYLAILVNESIIDIFLFAVLFPFDVIIEYLAVARPHMLDYTMFYPEIILLFALIDIWFRHSRQKKKMANSDPGFLKHYDMRYPMEKENPAEWKINTEKYK